ncbi:MAG: TonB-dependent receptor [Bacteroidales bacterium]|nr:TonB-dependent receptor [Bacteroidales bacterium]
MKSKIFSILLMFLVSVGAWAQATQVNGTVYDQQGLPFPGASVIVSGTTQGTVTDLDGNFSLKVDNAAAQTLNVSCIGFQSQVVSLAQQQTGLKITLQEEAIGLEEVVAVGYGSVKKKDLTGSVATVNSETLAAVPVASATEALTGKMAGVQITTTEGSPDAEMKIRVRGGGSITQDNTPLFIVDGFPVESISDIPASEIEDMTVLKDASSTAIYGSRGANGVILITTKNGTDGKFAVSYNAYYAVKKIAKTLDVLDAGDYARWQYEYALLSDKMSGYESFFGSYNDIDLYDNAPVNDWQDLTFGRLGHTFNHNVNITGGTDKIKFSMGYAHMGDKAIMETSKFSRDNANLKLNAKPWQPVTLDFSVRYSKTNIYGGGANDVTSAYDSDKRLKYSVIYTPIPLANLDPNAGSDDDDLGNLYNPLQALADNDRQQERHTLNMGAALTIEPVKNLKLKSEVGYETYRNADQRYWGTTTYYVKNVPSADNQNMPAVQFATTERTRQRNTNTISFDFKKILPEPNHLSVMVGEEYVYTKSKRQTNVVHGFPVTFKAQDAWKLSTQGTANSIENFISPNDYILSFFGRANYDFDSKYLLSATFRADGSSKFADGNRWGYFPSAALAWRVSSEEFMAKTQDWLTDMKLRVSYGTAGNNNIPSDQINQMYENKTTTWVNGYGNYWAPSKTMANKDLKWETTVTRNVGLDYTIWNGKLSGSIEAYLNTTKDLLINFKTSGTGYDTQYRNMGETENKGLEFQITWNAINRDNYGLTIGANIGFNKNKITDLGLMEDWGESSMWASTEIQEDFWVAKGGRVGQIKGYRNAGRYEVSDFEGYDATSGKWILKEGVASDATVVSTKLRPGTMKIKDLNNDGLIDSNDQEIIGDTNPKHTGGLNINGRVFWFDIALNFNWSYGNDVYNANKIEFTSTGKYQYRNMIDDMAAGKRWTNLNEDGTLCNDPVKLAQMNQGTTMWSPYTDRMVLTDWAIEDASFLRLNTATIGYTVPKALTQKYKVNNLRFYATCYNVFCLTNYSGYDPEVSTMRKTNLTPGVDYSAYPKSRQFVIGANLNF